MDEQQHMQRVGRLTGALTRALFHHRRDLAPRDAPLFEQAAQYHDIGKIWIPPEILMKPSQLTEEEKGIVQQHPVFSEMLLVQVRAGVLSGIPGHLLELTADCAIYHHEWWNGKGYPYGLQGRKIPLVARIATICDAYDAMTSDRVYRKAHSHEFACEELKVNAGTQFDPNLVKVFLKSAIRHTTAMHS